MLQAITINETDNIAVCLTDLSKGSEVIVNGKKYTLLNNVQAKHKFALTDLQKGDKVYMYGVLVGTAKEDIKEGDALTVNNIAHSASEYTGKSGAEINYQAPDVSDWESRTFKGYHREDGQVGTANYWLVFPLVFCENRNIEILKTAFYRVLGYEKENKYVSFLNDLLEGQNGSEQDTIITQVTTEKPVFENIDGVKFLTHQGGCGGIRQDSEILCRLLSGYINNPNVAGATVLSLGCQNAQIKLFKDSLKSVNPDFNKPLIILDQQEIGTEEELLKEAISQTLDGLIEANKIERKPAPLSKLSIGLECGGSDGFSGISANPTLGRVSDLVSELGGKAILSEFPELCGVEQELIDRMNDDKMVDKFIDLMRTYEKAAEDSGSGFDMNPSPGNIKDGLITDAMKSAGAAKKGGNSPVKDVLDYTEYVKNPGLNLLCTPGNDVESTTGLAGSGANIILFTTGLGTPTGNPVTPVIKVSSNSKLAEKMPDIIDFNTGPVIEGEKSIEEMGDDLLNLIIDVASGNKKTKAMELQQEDFIPWKRGVSL
ncbi:UxaA family hydrolase [Mangrovivirga cuniculi]|uniref:Altronate hydrolase n=1 Tax=Mangrovivirga cuniculi TaxID=2715131 RepID=A0A4D7JQK0_9BACT|nr:altronate dehydratase family protein [Mangrovivirga cuniculi]QCK13275.1 altronate hydrolase [Mangrovivirga cuniculi]